MSLKVHSGYIAESCLFYMNFVRVHSLPCKDYNRQETKSFSKAVRELSNTGIVSDGWLIKVQMHVFDYSF